jgi:hypothetical protein
MSFLTIPGKGENMAIHRNSVFSALPARHESRELIERSHQRESQAQPIQTFFSLFLFLGLRIGLRARYDNREERESH